MTLTPHPPGNDHKGPMKLYLFVAPFICLKFFSELAIKFFWNLSRCLGAHIGLYVILTEPIFLEKPCLEKKKWNKLANNRIDGFLMKIMSLVLSESGVKRKFLSSFNTLWKLHVCKNYSSDLSYDLKSSWPIRFEYYLITNNWLFNFFSKVQWKNLRASLKRLRPVTGHLLLEHIFILKFLFFVLI